AGDRPQPVISLWVAERTITQGARRNCAPHRSATTAVHGRRFCEAARLPSTGSRVRGDSVRDGRSRQPNTHNTEWRNVCYPWHPCFGRTVAVYEVFIKRGQSLGRCGLEEERNGRSVEIPAWMLEPATCCRLRMMAVPTVNCDALLALKALLR